MSGALDTLLLDIVTWDLCLDSNGNIAVATPPYSTTQDVATACRVFEGDLYYDTTQGIPYFQIILGKLPPLMLVKTLYIDAAEAVPGVASAQCFFSGFTNRGLTGQIQVTDTSGTMTVAAF